MERADQLAVLLGEFEEGAVPQPDPRPYGAVLTVPVGGEAEVVQQLDEPRARLLGSGRPGRRRGLDQGTAPVAAGLHGRGTRFGSGGREPAEQHLREHPVTALSAPVHARAGGVDGPRAPRAGGLLHPRLDEPLADQRLQVEPHRVGVDTETLGRLRDADGGRGRAQHVEDLTPPRTGARTGHAGSPLSHLRVISPNDTCDNSTAVRVGVRREGGPMTGIDRQGGEEPEAEIPRVLCDTGAALAAAAPDTAGVLWKLTESGRQLDANLV